MFKKMSAIVLVAGLIGDVAVAGEAKWVLGTKLKADEATVFGQSEGKPIYICKLPVPSRPPTRQVGKAINNFCFVGFSGQEIKLPMQASEILVLPDTTWVEATSGTTPKTAVNVGQFNNLPMHICRFKMPSGELHPGKSWNGTCYVPFAGKELNSKTFEYLTASEAALAAAPAPTSTPSAAPAVPETGRPTMEAKWIAGAVPADATVAGQSGGKPLNICRMTMPNKEVHMGKAWSDTCYVGFGGQELKAPLAQAEVLSLANSSWVEVKNGVLPAATFFSGMSGGSPMSVCRAVIPNGEAHPGKLWRGNCYIGFGGKELKISTYEVLTVSK